MTGSALTKLDLRWLRCVAETAPVTQQELSEAFRPVQGQRATNKMPRLEKLGCVKWYMDGYILTEKGHRIAEAQRIASGI